MKKLALFTFFIAIGIFSQQASAQNHKHAKKHVATKHHQPAKVHKHKHYSRSKIVVLKHRKNHSMAALPVGHFVITHKGTKHFYHNGLFYRQHNNAFHVFAPPIGIRIRTLPSGHYRFVHQAVPHFYYHGVFYQQRDNEYEVVEPQVGMIVPEIPNDDVDEITIDGEKLYAHDNVLYKQITTKGVVQYEVVGTLTD